MNRKDIIEVDEKRLKHFSIKCSEEKSTERYQNALRRLDNVIWKSFIPTIRTILFASTRSDLYVNFLSIRMIDELLESAVSILFLADQGFINQCKRELRFTLEASLKYWFINQQMMGSAFEEKMLKFNEILPNSSLNFLDKIDIYGLPEKNDFKAATNCLYKDLCKYVHASNSQSSERITKSSRGEYLGFTSSEEIEDLSKLVFQTFDIILSCQFSALGPSMTGDLFINVYDDQTEWAFHKGYFVSRISKSYDYKYERKNKK